MTEHVLSCARCMYWMSHPDGKAGICRRRAPVAVPILAPTEPRAGLALTMVWPSTQAVDWCGEHTARVS
jgi:hypothetical protein